LISQHKFFTWFCLMYNFKIWPGKSTRGLELSWVYKRIKTIKNLVDPARPLRLSWHVQPLPCFFFFCEYRIISLGSFSKGNVCQRHTPNMAMITFFFFFPFFLRPLFWDSCNNSKKIMVFHSNLCVYAHNAFYYRKDPLILVFARISTWN
jgi:hypothetical protein